MIPRKRVRVAPPDAREKGYSAARISLTLRRSGRDIRASHAGPDRPAGGNSSVGRARPCQGRSRGFESRFPLQLPRARPFPRKGLRVAAPGWRRSQVVRQGSAKPPFGGSNPPGASSPFRGRFPISPGETRTMKSPLRASPPGAGRGHGQGDRLPWIPRVSRLEPSPSTPGPRASAPAPPARDFAFRRASGAAAGDGYSPGRGTRAGRGAASRRLGTSRRRRRAARTAA